MKFSLSSFLFTALLVPSTEVKGACTWETVAGEYVSGGNAFPNWTVESGDKIAPGDPALEASYADGYMLPLTLVEAQVKCFLLGASLCNAVTCLSDGNGLCTVRFYDGSLPFAAGVSGDTSYGLPSTIAEFSTPELAQAKCLELGTNGCKAVFCGDLSNSGVCYVMSSDITSPGLGANTYKPSADCVALADRWNIGEVTASNAASTYSFQYADMSQLWLGTVTAEKITATIYGPSCMVQEFPTTCVWMPQLGVIPPGIVTDASSYADGDMFEFTLVEAQVRCLALGPTSCQAVTCLGTNVDSLCTVRNSAAFGAGVAASAAGITPVVIGDTSYGLPSGHDTADCALTMAPSEDLTDLATPFSGHSLTWTQTKIVDGGDDANGNPTFVDRTGIPLFLQYSISGDPQKMEASASPKPVYGTISAADPTLKFCVRLGVYANAIDSWVSTPVANVMSSNYGSGTHCDGWGGITAEQCKAKCLNNEVPTDCTLPNFQCSFAIWYDNPGASGWCDVYSSEATFIDSTNTIGHNTELWTRKFKSEEINFFESVVTITVTFNGNFEVLGIGVAPKVQGQSTAAVVYKAKAELCGATGTKTPLAYGQAAKVGGNFNQGAAIMVCISLDDAAKDDNVKLVKIKTFNWDQEGSIAKTQVGIDANGPAGNGLTIQSAIKNGPTESPKGTENVIVTSVLFAKFYEEVGSVKASGEVEMIFASRRRLGTTDNRRLQEADPIAAFDVDATLNKADDGPVAIQQTAGGNGGTYSISNVVGVAITSIAGLLLSNTVLFA